LSGHSRVEVEAGETRILIDLGSNLVGGRLFGAKVSGAGFGVQGSGSEAESEQGVEPRQTRCTRLKKSATRRPSRLRLRATC
jgi:hypothetical protein